MSDKTGDNRSDAHWPSIDRDYTREFAKFTRMKKSSAKPKCRVCRSHCWYSFTEHRWRHWNDNSNPERFAHEGGETMEDVDGS